MDSVDQIEALARRLFDAIERGSIDEVLEIYAPDAVIWHNTDGLETGPADNVAVLTAFVGRISERRYRDRRLKAFPGGFVQQHVLTGVRRDGRRLQLPACLVCKVENGRITRLDEYFDSAAVAPWREPC
ncbi:MAG: nuclear transport factor 2 family protein [Gammaproteobacteria bacterium]